MGDMVRAMHSHRITEFPDDCCLVARVQAKKTKGPMWRHVTGEIDREGFSFWRFSKLNRAKKREFHVLADDLLGARLDPVDPHQVIVHYMTPGKGVHEKRLCRRHRTVGLRLNDAVEASKWMRSINVLVKWYARVPLGATRRIKVVVNPHSGKRRGRQIWRKWAPIFAMAGIECDVEETKRSGHARDIGQSFDLSKKYEAMVFIGGDGTVNEFMNGVFARPEEEWRHLVATTPLSLLCAGTDNAFGLGVGTPTHEAAVYCIITRKSRPLDVIAVEGELADGTRHREFACCGVSYGIGADVAVESEQTRWLGVHRYKWLKVKRGILAPRPHEGQLKYVLSETVERDPESGDQLLQTYYEIADHGAHDQHHVEMCSVYDSEYPNKRWEGDAASIFHPASEATYAGQWVTEQGQYTTVGASNVYFETEFAHPSDGNMDLIVVRKGDLGKSVDVALRYVAGSYLQSELVDYFKIKALVIDQKVDDPINVDGEVFPGPGPFRMEIVPRLLCVLSEK